MYTYVKQVREIALDLVKSYIVFITQVKSLCVYMYIVKRLVTSFVNFK